MENLKNKEVSLSSQFFEEEILWTMARIYQTHTEEGMFNFLKLNPYMQDIVSNIKKEYRKIRGKFSLEDIVLKCLLDHFISQPHINLH